MSGWNLRGSLKNFEKTKIFLKLRLLCWESLTVILNLIREKFLPIVMILLRMYEDLGMDSLTMLEVVMLVEQTLEVSIDNEELRDLRTIGDVKAYLNAKAKGEEPPKRMKTYRIEEIASLMPHKEPFMFLESASIAGDKATARYKITGNEYFLRRAF